METLLLKVSFLGHLLIFISSFMNIIDYIHTPPPILCFMIYSTYFSDMLNCYKGVIPFYRCHNTKDIYIHHMGALFIFTMTIPSMFVNNPIKNKLINKITSVAFVSSLNEAIMIYGTSYPMSRTLTAFELMYKIYLFSLNAYWNSLYKIKLMSILESKDILLYIFCLSGLSFYILLYPRLLKGSIYKLQKLITNYP